MDKKNIKLFEVKSELEETPIKGALQVVSYCLQHSKILKEGPIAAVSDSLEQDDENKIIMVAFKGTQEELEEIITFIRGNGKFKR